MRIYNDGFSTEDMNGDDVIVIRDENKKIIKLLKGSLFYKIIKEKKNII